jgi:hypothetical protein
MGSEALEGAAMSVGQSPATSTLEHPRTWRFSLRTLLMVTVVVGCGAGLLAKAWIEYALEPSWAMHEAVSKQQALLKALKEEFESQNPATLDGWTVQLPGPNRRWLTWSKEGIGFYDRNGDGRPDRKDRKSPRISTSEVWWEDTDYDGTFDTEVSQGCFHHSTAPLPKPIAVPSVSANLGMAP